MIILILLILLGTTLYRFGSSYFDKSNGLYSQGLEFGIVTSYSGNRTYEVVGIGSCKDTEVRIPDTYKGKTVTGIGNNAFYGADIEKVIIPSSVTYIYSSAFKDCDNLVEIKIVSSATTNNVISVTGTGNLSVNSIFVEIGERAFENCTSLTEVEIPFGIISIDEYAFGYCKSLIRIKVMHLLDHLYQLFIVRQKISLLDGKQTGIM